MEISKTLDNSKLLKYSFLALLGSALLIISAKIKIPFYPVPMTMQTFVVVMLGMTLGSKIGTSAVIIYLFEGILGFPVFSNSPEKGIGITYFTGPTMGYLIGFVFAAYLSGVVILKYNYFKIFLVIILSISIIYILGLIWLGNLIGWDKPIFNLGAKPFLLAETFKVFLLLICSKYLIKFRKFI